MKSLINKFVLVLALALIVGACKDSYLEIPPTGQLTEEVLNSKKGVEGLLIGAYSMLGGRGN
ncbi:MAG: hypothetical protein KDD12_21430, partial [Lewinella sp.]|nr:hypothetical protein [Lewinella sp.]